MRIEFENQAFAASYADSSRIRTEIHHIGFYIEDNSQNPQYFPLKNRGEVKEIKFTTSKLVS